MEYGERLTAALKHANKSRKDLAAALHITVQAVGQVARGDSGAFNATNNARAAAFLGVSAAWLATEDGKLDDLTHPAAKPLAANEDKVKNALTRMTAAEDDMLDDIRDLTDEDRIEFAALIKRRAEIQRRHWAKHWPPEIPMPKRYERYRDSENSAVKISDRLKQRDLLEDDGT